MSLSLPTLKEGRAVRLSFFMSYSYVLFCLPTHEGSAVMVSSF